MRACRVRSEKIARNAAIDLRTHRNRGAFARFSKIGRGIARAVG